MFCYNVQFVLYLCMCTGGGGSSKFWVSHNIWRDILPWRFALPYTKWTFNFQLQVNDISKFNKFFEHSHSMIVSTIESVTRFFLNCSLKVPFEPMFPIVDNANFVKLEKLCWLWPFSQCICLEMQFYIDLHS